MHQDIAYTSLLVRDYDEAIAYFTTRLGFTVRQDTRVAPDKRWVVVAPSGSAGAGLLLARAKNETEAAAVGRQTGGRVFLFLETDDFWRDYGRFRARGVEFLEEPRIEAYGTVAVFTDHCGNRWDLLQSNRRRAPEATGAGPVLTFRRGHPTSPDAAALIDELSTLLNQITGSPGTASFSADDIADDRAAFLLLIENERPVGCGAIRPIDARTCELKRMYVRDRTRGLGSQLLRRLEAEAVAIGYDQVWLETRKVNGGAVAFYRRRGYAEIPNFGKYAGNDAAICFGKTLDAANAGPPGSARAPATEAGLSA